MLRSLTLTYVLCADCFKEKKYPQVLNKESFELTSLKSLLENKHLKEQEVGFTENDSGFDEELLNDEFMEAKKALWSEADTMSLVATIAQQLNSRPSTELSTAQWEEVAEQAFKGYHSA